jgi:hypothetical protein
MKISKLRHSFDLLIPSHVVASSFTPSLSTRVSFSPPGWRLFHSYWCFFRLWESRNTRIQCQKVLLLLLSKNPGHFAARTEFGETLGHNPLNLMWPERVASLSKLWLCFCLPLIMPLYCCQSDVPPHQCAHLASRSSRFVKPNIHLIHQGMSEHCAKVCVQSVVVFIII